MIDYVKKLIQYIKNRFPARYKFSRLTRVCLLIFLSEWFLLNIWLLFGADCSGGWDCWGQGILSISSIAVFIAYFIFYLLSQKFLPFLFISNLLNIGIAGSSWYFFIDESIFFLSKGFLSSSFYMWFLRDLSPIAPFALLLTAILTTIALTGLLALFLRIVIGRIRPVIKESPTIKELQRGKKLTKYYLAAFLVFAISGAVFLYPYRDEISFRFSGPLLNSTSDFYYNCPKMKNFNLKYPEFIGWEWRGEENNEADECIIFLNNDRLAANNIDTEIAPQIKFSRIYYNGVPGKMQPPDYLTETNASGVRYGKTDLGYDFWTTDSIIRIELLGVIEKYGFYKKFFWQTVIESFELMDASDKSKSNSLKSMAGLWYFNGFGGLDLEVNADNSVTGNWTYCSDAECAKVDNCFPGETEEEVISGAEGCGLWGKITNNQTTADFVDGREGKKGKIYLKYDPSADELYWEVLEIPSDFFILPLKTVLKRNILN